MEKGSGRFEADREELETALEDWKKRASRPGGLSKAEEVWPGILEKKLARINRELKKITESEIALQVKRSPPQTGD